MFSKTRHISPITFPTSILDPDAGALTNFEVLDLLRSRAAIKDPTRLIAPVSKSELEVCDYLEKSVACNQTREVCKEFVDECKRFDFAKTEIINIVNGRPISEPEIYPIIMDYESGRLENEIEDLIEIITRILPPHPSHMQNSNEETTNDGEETAVPEPNNNG